MDGPHNDALVLTLDVSNCVVSRILVDNETSVNVIYLRKMDINESKVEKGSVKLTGFDGKSTLAIWSIKLAVYACGENKLI